MELSPYYEKQLECLHCKQQFKTMKVRSNFIKVKENESDFRPIYENDVNPLFYNVFVCEHCGFSFTEDFSKYFAPGVKEAIDQHITTHWKKHSFAGERSIADALQAYQLGLVCGNFKKEKHITLAGLALRISWLYRMTNQDVMEKRFMKIAREQYIESYSVEDYKGTSMNELWVLYLIGEISRRMGDKEQAIRYFSKVIEKQRLFNEPKILEMAKDQWKRMREE